MADDKERPATDPKTEPDTDCEPTADGILGCLHMLAREAETLRLSDTRRALEAVIAVCAEEAMQHAGDPGIAPPAPRHTTLH